MRFLIKLIINALALWLTTFVVAGVSVTAFSPGGRLQLVLTYLLLALIFGLVNGIVGTVIRVVAFPLYILTLGLIALVVNALLLLIVGWISQPMGFGLQIDGFWSGFWGAIVLAIISWIIGMFARPLTRR